MKHIKKIVFILSILSTSLQLIAESAAPPKNAVTGNAAVIQSFGKKHAEHIVSLSPAATEILCAIGAHGQIAARTDLCDYPPEVKQIPSAGGFDGKSLSIEKILSFQPDLVYATKTMHDHLIEPLRSYGIRVYVSNADSVEEVIEEIGDMGIITGHTSKAAAVQQHIHSTIIMIRNAIRNKPVVRVYWEVWNSPYMSAGNTSFINDLIMKAGGTNIFADTANAYPLVSEEAIIARNPDIIIIPGTGSLTADMVTQRTGWNSIKAVKNKRIFFVDDNITSRPGPRIADALVILARAIHPDAEFSGVK